MDHFPIETLPLKTIENPPIENNWKNTLGMGKKCFAGDTDQDWLPTEAKQG